MQQTRSTRSHLIGILAGNSDLERVLRTDRAFFRTIMCRDAITFGHHSNSAAVAADQNAWTFTLNEMDHDDKPAGTSEGQARKTIMRKDFTVMTLNKEELRSLIQIKGTSAVAAAHQEETKCMFRNLVEEIIWDTFSNTFCTLLGESKRQRV